MTQERNNNAVQVPMPDVVRFVRQLSHDLRNHLNAAELQAAYMNEVATEASLKEEVQRLRSLLSEMGRSLERLSTSLASPKLTRMPYEAEAFAEDLQQKIAAQFPQESGAIDWKGSAGAARLEIDPQLLQQGLMEIIDNAFQHGRNAEPMTARVEAREGEFVFELREPKKDFAEPTENWGREPFRHVAHGHYGLGLHRARSIIEAHEGQLDVRYDPAASALITRVVLPLHPAE